MSTYELLRSLQEKRNRQALRNANGVSNLVGPNPVFSANRENSHTFSKNLFMTEEEKKIKALRGLDGPKMTLERIRRNYE